MEIQEIKSRDEFNEIVNSNEMVLVDFYATWCGPCKMMSPVIDDIANEYKNVKVIKANVDNNNDLVNTYNIMSIPTIMVFKSGEVFKTFVGVVDKKEIISQF